MELNSSSSSGSFRMVARERLYEWNHVANQASGGGGSCAPHACSEGLVVVVVRGSAAWWIHVLVNSKAIQELGPDHMIMR